MPNFGFTCFEQFYEELQIQDAHNASLLRPVLLNDWFMSVDLKITYIHIPVYPPHRKQLQFAFRGTCYEYSVLPFSPRVFVCCSEAATTPLRQSGMHLISCT